MCMCHEVQRMVSGLPKLGLQVRGSHLTVMQEQQVLLITMSLASLVFLSCF